MFFLVYVFRILHTRTILDFLNPVVNIYLSKKNV